MKEHPTVTYEYQMLCESRGAIVSLNKLAEKGWKLHTAVLDEARGQMIYLMEREVMVS